MVPGTILLIIVGVVLLWRLVDILLTGGSMTGWMTPAAASGAGVGGMMTMASNPVGAVVLLLLLAIGALVAYLAFFT
jgi:hypothetical protein